MDKTIKFNSIIKRVKLFCKRNNIILDDLDSKAQNNRVSVDFYSLKDPTGLENLGDGLSPIIVEYVCQLKNLSLKTTTSNMHHLYAIGSIITIGLQDACIWGSGFIDKPKTKLWYKIRKFDIRCVRGPETRNILLSLGYDCPDVYGDPALLLPLFYKPNNKEIKYSVSIIPHMHETNRVKQMKIDSHINNCKIIDIRTNDWQKTVDEIYNSKLVISSSLHGIILAEAYGIPAVLWMPENSAGGGLVLCLNIKIIIMEQAEKTFPW